MWRASTQGGRKQVDRNFRAATLCIQPGTVLHKLDGGEFRPAANRFDGTDELCGRDSAGDRSADSRSFLRRHHVQIDADAVAGGSAGRDGLCFIEYGP